MTDWAEIAERCRQALSGVKTAVARVRACDEAGAISSTTASYVAPDRWHIDQSGLRRMTCVDHRLMIWAGGQDPRQERVETPWRPGKYLASLGWGEPELFRNPASFAKALSPVGTTQVAGRACYQVHLGGARNKPGDLDVAVDRGSYLVLAWHNRASGRWAWVDELILNGPVEPDLFTLPAEDRALLGARTRYELADSMSERIDLPSTVPDSGEQVTWSPRDGDPASGAFLTSGRLDNRRRAEFIRQPKSGPVPLRGQRDWAPQRILSWTEDDFTVDLLLE